VATPNVEQMLGLAPPFFVRKLVRASHWGAAADDIQQRVNTAVSEGFRSEGSGTFSMYLVERDLDFYRIAMGLNGNRGSLTESLCLIGFSPQEVDDCSIKAINSAGTTKCSHANRCHFDLMATKGQLDELCRAAMTAGRPVGRLNKRHLQPMVEQAQEDGCRAVEKSEHCACDDE